MELPSTLKVLPIDKDGHCFYRCVALDEGHKNSDDQTNFITNLRSKVMQSIKDSTPEEFLSLEMSREKRSVERIGVMKPLDGGVVEYARLAEIKATSELLMRPILIFQQHQKKEEKEKVVLVQAVGHKAKVHGTRKSPIVLLNHFLHFELVILDKEWRRAIIDEDLPDETNISSSFVESVRDHEANTLRRKQRQEQEKKEMERAVALSLASERRESFESEKEDLKKTECEEVVERKKKDRKEGKKVALVDERKTEQSQTEMDEEGVESVEDSEEDELEEKKETEEDCHDDGEKSDGDESNEDDEDEMPVQKPKPPTPPRTRTNTKTGGKQGQEPISKNAAKPKQQSTARARQTKTTKSQ